MSVEKANRIFFLGIGGIGMSALARYCASRGKKVSGYDRTETSLTRNLVAEGIAVSYEDKISNLAETADLVIYTPAIPGSNSLFKHFKESKTPIIKRSQALGEITAGKFTIAVAGTHGKTTITSIIAHILYTAGYEVTALVGGICKNYQSNYISRGGDKIMVVEADEYDRSFLELAPDIAVISSIDADHLDIYESEANIRKSFELFTNCIKPKGKVIMWHSLDLKMRGDILRIDYAVGAGGADFIADNIMIQGGKQHFSIFLCHCDIHEIHFNLPGRHNIANALAAAAACMRADVKGPDIKTGLESYTGVERRFDIRVPGPGTIYIDDYAHHPEELTSCITSIREMYPGKKLTGIFQPHLYTRTRDFAEAFAVSLDLLDEAILLDIYPAREEPIEGVSSAMILEQMKLENKTLTSKKELLALLETRKPEILVTMGAGDIDQMTTPIEKWIQEAGK